MKKLPLLFTLVTMFAIIGCSSDDATATNNNNTPTGKSLFKFNFETGNDGFYEYQYGSGIPVKSGMKDIPTAAGSTTCGHIYRGKSSEFSKWKGFDFEGNSTYFIGYDMGRCGGYSKGITHRDITFEKDYEKNKLKLQFKYYKPGDLAGLGNYFMDVYIAKKGESNPTENHLLKIQPKIDPSGWVTYSEFITTKIPKGEYQLIVHGANAGSFGVDDIELIEFN